MKKIYSLLASLLVCFMGVTMASAQSDVVIKWEVGEEPITEVSDGMYVVLQQGTYAAWSKNGYLNPSGSYLATVDPTCIYQLKQVDTASDGAAIYVLQNVSNKQYIYSGGHTLSYSDAFQCSAEVSEVDSENPRKKIYGQDRQVDSEGRTMVFCSKDPNNDEGTSWTYLCYWGCPAYSSYSDTNDWFVYEAKSHEATSREKFEMAYNDFFKNGFDAEAFPVGVNPGCISQAIFDQISAVYEEAYAATDNESLSDAELDEITAHIRAAQKAYEEGLVLVEPGKYYAFVCLRSNDMMYEDNANNLKATAGMAALPEEITVDEAKYIFQTEDAGDGYLYIKNLATGNYWSTNPGTSAQWKTIATATNKFTIPRYSGTIFNQRHSSGNYTHIDGGMKLVQWNAPGGAGCQYYVHLVDADKVTPLLTALEKQQFITTYKNYYASAKAVPGMYLYASGITMDGNYASPGLVGSATTNAQETSEGPIANLFDGNYTTYFHSKWQGAAIDNDWDWIEVDLGKEVSNIAVKFSLRHNNQRNAPTRAALVAPAADDDPAGAWTDTLWRDTVIYEYSTPYPAGAINNTTAIIQVKDLKAPVQKLRFAVINTANNSSNGDGPFFALSEFRVYEEDGSINPKYNLIPEAIRQELDNQLAASEAMLVDSIANNTPMEDLQAGYAALEAAVEAFEAAYPDDSHLQSLIARAYQQAEAEGMEGDAWGYFQTGAQATLKGQLEAIEAEIGEKVLNLDEIAKYEAAVEAAVKEFNGKLNVPADGTLIRIVGAAVDGNGEPVNANGNYVYAADADSVNNIRWGYNIEDINRDARINCIWQYIQLEGGKFALRNVGTGKYISNIYKDAESYADVDRTIGLKSVDQPEPFTAITSKIPGVYNIELIDYRYMNGDPSGSVVIWTSTGGNSNFVFEAVDADEAGTDFITPAKAGKTQVITLPFAITYADPVAYKVLGAKDGELQLQLYDDAEGIPAGTPFVVVTDADQTYINFGIDATDINDLVNNGKYEYGHIDQNGLIGTLQSLKLPAGLGLILDEVVKLSVDNTALAAGSGYFKYINATDDEGDLKITIEEMPDGISGITLNPAAASKGIYTISGVRVNGKNLPKGVYIINGEKVVK
ncbi:MAG: discoidin domain-containing protein [Bacteroidales bacterium]|nr:discoidin domain-containing protein [Bacteroidales bacterium]